MQYSFLLFAIGAAAAAVDTVSSAAPSSSISACDAVYNACIQSQLPSPNFSTCNAERDACLSGVPFVTATVATPITPVPTVVPTKCDAVYNACIQSQGPNPNFSTCNAERDACLSGVPFVTGTVATPITPVPTGSSTNITAKCDAVYDACIQSQLPVPNFSTCNAEKAACLGGDTIVTTVVTAFTTVCPTPTTLTYGGSTYTVTSSTTLTITNCPCTITHPAGQPAPTPTAAPPATTGTSKCDAVYNACIQSQLPVPNFSTCNAEKAACLAGVPFVPTPVGTPGPSVPAFTGAAAHQTAGVMGLVALGALAML